MNITVIHSHQEKCGVREYGRQLDQSLRLLGATIRPFSYASFAEATTTMEPGEILLVHYEQGLTQTEYLSHYLQLAKQRGCHTVLCCHWYEHNWVAPLAQAVDKFVLHRSYAPRHEQTVVIPLGCPVYEPKPRAALRKKLGLSPDKIVMTTIGFLTRWKMMPEVTEAMLRAMQPHPQLFLHLHTPWPFNTYDARTEEPRIRRAIEELPHGEERTLFSNEFLPEQATLDIARAADLGFVFHNIPTHSVSAATKQFVSARRPLVVTGSNHASDIRGGVVRVETTDAGTFARAVVEVALDQARRTKLQQEMETEYKVMNMNAVAHQYLDLFRSLS